MNTHRNRIAILKAMHTLIVYANDESAYMEWIYLVPDAPDEDDFDDIAQDDDLYGECCVLFRKLMKKYGDSGFYAMGDHKAF